MYDRFHEQYEKSGLLNRGGIYLLFAVAKDGTIVVILYSGSTWSFEKRLERHELAVYGDEEPDMQHVAQRIRDIRGIPLMLPLAVYDVPTGINVDDKLLYLESIVMAAAGTFTHVHTVFSHTPNARGIDTAKEALLPGQSLGDGLEGTNRELPLAVFKPKPKNVGFPCRVCGKQHPAVSELIKHLEAAHDTKRFGCTQCDYASNDSHTLRAHALIHVEEAMLPLACDEEGCSKRFKRQRDLNAHVKSVHLGLRKPCPFGK